MAQDNLVANGGMEDGGSYPSDWNRLCCSSRDTAVSRSGIASLQANANSSYTYDYQSILLQPNTEYTLSAWIKTQNVNGYARVRFSRIQPDVITWNSTSVSGTQDWTYVSVTFTTPSQFYEGRLDLIWDFDSGTAWYDDVVLVENGATQPGTPSEIRLTAYDQKVVADGVRRTTIQAQITDAEGDLVTSATNAVTFSISGTGTLDGVNPSTAINGEARIEVISPTSGGSSCTIQATATGLVGDSATVQWVEPRMQISDFPLGVFDDMTLPCNITCSINDLQAHNLDTLMIVNAAINNAEWILNGADAAGFNTIMSPAGTLGSTWWDSSVAATIENARSAAQQIIDAWAWHPSLIGYHIIDEPGLDKLTKTALLNQAFNELDTENPAAPVLIGTDRVGPIFDASNPPVMIIDLYPCGYNKPVGDFNMSHWGYSHLEAVDYFQYVSQTKPQGVPLWLIMQSHNFQTQLREPVPAEIRCQHWMAVGEGATGMIWFIYTSSGDPSQDWTGLYDNPPLYNTVAELAGRTIPLKSTLLNLERAADVFQVSSSGNAYISTLRTTDASQYYAVTCNLDCVNTRALTITSNRMTGVLRNIETGSVYQLGDPITLSPGYGGIFELLAELDEESPTAPTNLTVTDTSSRSVSLSWGAATDNEGVAGYRIYIDGSEAGTTAQLAYTAGGLDPDTQYSFYVTAYDANQNESDPTDTVYATTDVSTFPTDLMAYWPMDENSGTTAQDITLNGYDGTLTNGASWTQGAFQPEENYDWAVQLDGSNDHVYVGSMDIAGSELTLSAWVYAESFDTRGRDNRILSKAVGSGEQDHYWMISTVESSGFTRMRFRLKTGNPGTTTTLIADSGSIDTHEWVHVAATYDGTAMKLYQNGILVGSTPASGDITQAPSVPLRIGINPGDYRGWDGAIDDVRIYNRALTTEELDDVMNKVPFEPQYNADLNDDGSVNLIDYGMLSDQWSSTGCADPDWCNGADINRDSTVDSDDMTIFTNLWLE